MNSRANNLIRNVTIGLLAELFLYILSFAYRTVFIRILGITYLGAQGLFSNILNLLSFAELGVGNAILFSLYKPLAEKDYARVGLLMKTFRNMYIIIGTFILLAGGVLTPFLGSFIKDDPGMEFAELRLIYLLFLFDSAAAYFFAYKKTLFSADQRDYINIVWTTVFSLVSTLLQLVFLLLTKAFIVTLIIKILFTLLGNVYVSMRAGREYKNMLLAGKHISAGKDFISDLYRKIGALIMHKAGALVIGSTDNILISKYIGFDIIGIYANYTLIVGIVGSVFTRVIQAAMASVGNLTATANVSHARRAFALLDFAYYWMYFFCSIALYILLNPFIGLWFGKGFLLDDLTVSMIAVSFYTAGRRQNTLTFRNALGLFWNDRYKPLIEAVAKLALSIMLLHRFGIGGIFMGTIISSLLTSAWVEPYVLFKNYFHEKVLHYLLQRLVQTVELVSIALLLHLISRILFDNGWPSFMLLMFLVVLITNGYLIVRYRKKEECKQLVGFLFSMIRKRKKTHKTERRISGFGFNKQPKWQNHVHK